MRIGQVINGYQVLAFVPYTEKEGIWYLTGVRPGNKRPEYATWRSEGDFNSGPESDANLVHTSFRPFSAHNQTAGERKHRAYADLMKRSGMYMTVAVDLVREMSK